jgi:hypothetical protein
MAQAVNVAELTKLVKRYKFAEAMDVIASLRAELDSKNEGV